LVHVNYVHPFVVSVYLIPLLADGPLPLDPSSSVLHYAQTVFEGMKAYRKDDGKVVLFRPDMNMKRMNSSAKRIALPVRIDYAPSCLHSYMLFQTFNGHSLLQLIKQLVSLDKHWIPKESGHSLYVRPTLSYKVLAT
jgi:branched-chain amino acid aminotransferase